MKFNIFGKLEEEIQDFDFGGVWIVGKPKNENTVINNSKRGEKGGYYFSQKDLLESIDLACASKFKKGIRDSEGQRKTYLNVVNFFRDVTKMKINIDASNYIFEPESDDFVWPVFIMDKKFKQWADDESYDDQLDEYAHDLSTYGTTIAKKLETCTARVPLRTLRVTQTAKSLLDAAQNAGYVLIENDFHYNQIKDYPDWDISNLSKNKKYLTYERYALVPKKMLENDLWKTQTSVEINDEDEMVMALSILIPTAKGPKDVATGKIAFMMELTEETFPLEECHAEKVDGRWMGRGEVEKQLENQIARNLNANLRRRGLLWAVKKIYQSSDPDVAKNLLMEVKDGEVIEVKPNGTITPVNTQSQHNTDIAADENAWKENSQQISFAFNAATGEDMPSQTPFRLGVLLAGQVADHFKLIRKTYSNFLKRSFFDQLVPIFKKEYSEAHKYTVPIGASDIEHLKESMMVFHTNLRMFDAVMKGKPFNMDQTRNDIMNEMNRNPYLFIDMPEDSYKDLRHYMRLNIVDDITADVASLTSLYQAMSAKGDPRAEEVLKKILQKQGKSLNAIAGPSPAPQALNPQLPPGTLSSMVKSPLPNPVAA